MHFEIFNVEKLLKHMYHNPKYSESFSLWILPHRAEFQMHLGAYPKIYNVLHMENLILKLLALKKKGMSW